MGKVIVVGGGPAGMFAAITAAKNGNQVLLLEKNEKLGKKLYITGKGRCNLTNDTVPDEFLNNVVVNSKFLFGAINALSPEDVEDFFERNGCKVKTERGNRVFPQSDKASDVSKALQKVLDEYGVEVRLNTSVIRILIDGNKISGVDTEYGFITSDSVIICTGGCSYHLTGSTGDGYIFAKSLGHSIVPPKPSLVGIELKGNDFMDLQGLSLKNVSVSFCDKNGKCLYSDFGEMLFTHYGVSGPIILSASCILNKFDLVGVKLSIDLKPALSHKILDYRLIREFSTNCVKTISTVLKSLLPQSLIEIVLIRANISGKKRCADISKEERLAILTVLKNLSFEVDKLRPLEEAIVTSGGVSVKEVNPKTMESKIVKGLFFAGEVLDVDAFTGGFNIQIAFSTGYVAGKNA